MNTQLTQLPFFQSLTGQSPLQQTLLFLTLSRLFIASLTLLLLYLSLHFDWGAAGFHLHWHSVLSWFSVILGFSLLSFSLRKVITSDNRLCSIFVLDAGLWLVFLTHTGGAMNPATSYFLVILCLCALSSKGIQTIGLFLLVIALYTYMMLGDTHSLHSMMGWHLWGMWLSFFATALLITLSIYSLNRRIQAKDQAIAKFKEETTRAEQLIMMGTLAASTAHEIGTPLATLAMISESLQEPEKSLALNQIKRCKKSLEQLKYLPEERQTASLSTDAFMEQLQHELLLIRPAATLKLTCSIHQPLHPPLALRQSLLALFVNAIDAAKTAVHAELTTNETMLIWQIRHDGALIDEPLLASLSLKSTKKHGIGIGYFLANASIEQLGGNVKIINEQHCVLTEVTIPHSSCVIHA